jgi:hypothetical protein
MVAAIAAVVVIPPGKSPATAYRAGSPSAAVQAWASALEAGDYTAADKYLSSGLQSQGMTSDQLLFGEKVVSLSVVGESIQGNSATVQATITTTSLFGDLSGNNTTSSAIPMILENGSWKIDVAILDTSI